MILLIICNKIKIKMFYYSFLGGRDILFIVPSVCKQTLYFALKFKKASRTNDYIYSVLSYITFNNTDTFLIAQIHF